MRCECTHKVNNEAETIIDFNLDVRLFDDDPIWDEMDSIDGVDYVYKPRNIKRMLAAFGQAHSLPSEDLGDRGTYRCQLRVAKLFDVEVVKSNVIRFFLGWQSGKALIAEIN